ncbi:MAG: response regulator, partial [Cellulosimicrobium funkei]
IVSGSQPSKAQATASLADRWLVKPVAPAELERTVKEAVSLRPHHEHVLVVEDDPEVGEVVRAVLQGAGLVVTLARSVHEALEVLAGGDDPALVVLDLTLPDGAGREVVDALRQDGRLSRVPLVIYSGARLDAHQRADLRLGDTVYLRKGSTAPEKLLEPVLDLLDTAAGRWGTAHDDGARASRTENT